MDLQMRACHNPRTSTQSQIYHNLAKWLCMSDLQKCQLRQYERQCMKWFTIGMVLSAEECGKHAT